MFPRIKLGDYWGFDTYSETMQYMENIAVFEMPLKVINLTIGAASLDQPPYNASPLPIRGGITLIGALS